MIRRLSVLLPALVVAALAVAPAAAVARTAQAQAIGTSAALLRAADDGAWILSADFDIALPAPVEEAVHRGLPLYFQLEFLLERPRWYLWDETVAEARQTWRLSHHALTRQYRLARGAWTQSFPSLGDALAQLSQVRGWRVVAPGKVRAGEQYQAAVRLRLDGSLLPRPLQFTAMTDRDWLPTAEWKRFPFTPETPRSVP